MLTGVRKVQISIRFLEASDFLVATEFFQLQADAAYKVVMNPQIKTVATLIGLMLASKQVPFDNPVVLTGSRLVYVFISLLTGGIYLYTKFQIDRKRDMTILKGEESIANDTLETPTTSIYNHDTQQWCSLIKNQLMSISMVAILHLYFKLPNPLLVQSIMTLKGALQSQLVLVHVFGKPAVGDLRRPWETSAGSSSRWKRLMGGTVVNKQRLAPMKHAKQDGNKED